MIWIEGENPANEQRMVDTRKVEEAVKETKRLLNSNELFEFAVGSGRREVLKELELW